jgi:hypothetical protein
MFPLSTPADDPLFEGGTIHHVVVPYDEAQQLPPYKPTHVVAYCFLIGNNSYDPKISMASFCLEREMAQLLDAKGKTNGMNTPYFPGRDMYVSMKPDADKLQVMFTLGAHRRVSYEGADTTRLDVLRALNSKPLLLMNYYLETPLIFPHS